MGKKRKTGRSKGRSASGSKRSPPDRSDVPGRRGGRARSERGDLPRHGNRGEGKRQGEASDAAGTVPGPILRRLPRIVLGAATLLILVAGGAVLRMTRSPPSAPVASGPLVLPPLRPSPTSAVSPADFVGADACAECHVAQYELWRRSTHGRAGGEPGPDLVIAPFDGTAIHFRDARVIPEVTAAGQYRFVIRQDGHPEQVALVNGVIGGGHMLGGGTQGFVTRFGDGTVRFLAFDWSRHEGAWFCNTGSRLDEGWVPITDDMALADCGDWPPSRVLGTVSRFSNCQECHGSQIHTEWNAESGTYETSYTSLAINCESCHGPGRRHVDLARAGSMGRREDVGLAPLATLSEDGSLEVCFRCHALKDVVREGWLPGDPLASYYTLKLPILGDDPYRPDGRVRTFAYQATHLFSDCYVNGSMSCVSCHEPHGQGYQDADGRPLASPFDDGQCTGCHPSKAEPLEAHTFHAPTSEGSRCVNCHMPYLQHPELGPGVRFARSDHMIPNPRPAFDDALGVESACLQCHPDRSPGDLQADVDAWYGVAKPHRPLVAGLLEATRTGAGSASVAEAAELLLRSGDPADAMAQFAGLARLLLDYLEPDDPDLPPEVVERLSALAKSPDLEVRALALASLHWSAASDPEVRAALVRAVEETRSPDEPLRRRWAMVLGFLGDRSSADGRAFRAETAFQKALEVLPEDVGILQSLGVHYTRSGSFGRAVEALQRSLAADPTQPLVRVNLGIALEGLGDERGAFARYREAAESHPVEPLAHFNVGNALLRREDWAGAASAYERAIALDPGLGRAYFYLGRAYIRLGRLEDALGAARRALEFEPDHDGARQMTRDLERALAARGAEEG